MTTVNGCVAARRARQGERSGKSPRERGGAAETRTPVGGGDGAAMAPGAPAATTHTRKEGGSCGRRAGGPRHGRSGTPAAAPPARPQPCRGCGGSSGSCGMTTTTLASRRVAQRLRAERCFSERARQRACSGLTRRSWSAQELAALKKHNAEMRAKVEEARARPARSSARRRRAHADAEAPHRAQVRARNKALDKLLEEKTLEGARSHVCAVAPWPRGRLARRRVLVSRP